VTQRKFLFLGLLGTSLIACTALLGTGGDPPTAPSAAPSAASPASSPSGATSAPKGTLVVCENVPWLLALAVPASAHVGPSTPWVVVAEVDSSLDAEVAQLDPKVCLTLGRAKDPTLVLPPSALTQRHLLGSDPATGSYRLATTVWKQSPKVVIARTKELAAVLQASALAASEGSPLLLFTPGRGPELRQTCATLGAKSATFVGAAPPASRLLGPKVTLRHLTPEQAPLDLAKRLRASGPVYALSVAEIPRAGEGSPAWLGPLYALARRAPLVLLPTARTEKDSGVSRAEAAIATVASACGPALRSLLVLGDEVQVSHGRLATSPGSQDGDEFEVRVEPASLPPSLDTIPGLGVGRIPWASLPLGSRILLRSIARSRLVRAPPRAWVAANPRPEHAPLPLCEVVARTTAHELTNHRVAVDGFFGQPVHTGAPQAALLRAQLVVFEGHSNDAYLFPQQAPSTGDPLQEFLDSPVPQEPHPEDPPEESEPDWNEPIHHRLVRDRFWAALAPEPPAPGPEPHEPDDAPPPAGQEAPGRDDSPDDDGDEIPFEEPNDPSLEEEEPEVRPQILRGAPLVFFQSCNSLAFSEIALRFGAAGVIGSTTRIHSASGSAFAHAFVQGLLWKGATVGEALRDTRSFFLLVDDLKVLRGQKKRREARRVAWSFLYLGDPELRPLALDARGPKRRGLALRPASGGALKVKAPRRRLAKSEARDFRMRAYARSYTAGMVRRSKKSKTRNLAPLHFFQAPPLAKGVRARFRRKRPAGGKRLRPGTVARTHPVTGEVYVLHFGPRLEPGATYTLAPRR